MPAAPLIAAPIRVDAVPLALYIHIPWCIKKCPYCDFNSHQQPEQLPEAAYVKQLLRDLSQQVARYRINRPIRSIFIGGGTPSLFEPAAIAELLEGVDQLTPLASECEITLEANPGTFEQARFAGFRQAGVNRLSIGVQSFNPYMLKRLGRVHSAQEAIRIGEFAEQAGFESYNLDLMFALPEQSVEQALEDLAQAIALSPTHLSWYQLTLEPNTAFFHNPPSLPDDDNAAQMQQAGFELLSQHGYQRYEVSAFAKPGYACQHNLNYWQFGDYLGIGAGAHGKLTDHDGKLYRYSQQRHPSRYLAARSAENFQQSYSQVQADDLCLEYMMNALRLTEGLSLSSFEQRTGLQQTHLQTALQRTEQKGLIEVVGDNVKTTDKGLLFLNDTLSYFFTSERGSLT